MFLFPHVLFAFICMTFHFILSYIVSLRNSSFECWIHIHGLYMYVFLFYDGCERKCTCVSIYFISFFCSQPFTARKNNGITRAGGPSQIYFIIVYSLCVLLFFPHHIAFIYYAEEVITFVSIFVFRFYVWPVLAPLHMTCVHTIIFQVLSILFFTYIQCLSSKFLINLNEVNYINMYSSKGWVCVVERKCTSQYTWSFFTHRARAHKRYCGAGHPWYSDCVCVLLFFPHHHSLLSSHGMYWFNSIYTL